MAEHKLRRTLRRRTSSDILLIQLAGYQAHHGGVHLHGLLAGKNGGSTVCRTINGQTHGE